MKKLFSLLIGCLLLVSLAACASTCNNEGAKVKCPACGYEFQAPTGNSN